jgi:hypothetical protein
LRFAGSDLRVLDPTWTTAYITRNHGYMVFDTLFALDSKFRWSATTTSRRISYSTALSCVMGSNSTTFSRSGAWKTKTAYGKNLKDLVLGPAIFQWNVEKV